MMTRINEKKIYQLLDHGRTSILINAVDIFDNEKEAIGYYNGLFSQYPLYTSSYQHALSLCMIEGIIQTAGTLIKTKNIQKRVGGKVLLTIENLHCHNELCDETNIVFYVRIISTTSLLDKFIGEIRSKEKTILGCNLLSGVTLK